MTVVVSNCPRRRWNGLKIWSYASARSVSSRSAVRGCHPVPQNWVAGGGAGGLRVLVIVTAVCVVAAVDDSVDGTVTVASVGVELACVK